ncbi:MAG: nucleotide-binding domain containing protein, partial [Planctomycetota bacterium]
MRESDLRLLLAAQTDRPIAHLPHGTVDAGADVARDALVAIPAESFVIADAVTEHHLLTLGQLAGKQSLVTGGSGIAMGLPAAYRVEGLLSSDIHDAPLPTARGKVAVLAGSCSQATLRQVARFEETHPVLRVGADAIVADVNRQVEHACDWITSQPTTGLVTTSVEPGELPALQQRHGLELVSERVERFFGELASLLVTTGDVGRLIVAGGETSGAVVKRLNIARLRIGPEIAPGVPWTNATVHEPDDLALALKSGNFGGDDFFREALEMLP